MLSHPPVYLLITWTRLQQPAWPSSGSIVGVDGDSGRGGKEQLELFSCTIWAREYFRACILEEGEDGRE